MNGAWDVWRVKGDEATRTHYRVGRNYAWEYAAEMNAYARRYDRHERFVALVSGNEASTARIAVKGMEG